MSSEILFYTGEGAGQFCSFALKEKLARLMNGNEYRIREITTFFDGWNDPSSVEALFVPGGNAAAMKTNSNLPYLIRDYRISYYGACAGGIIASATLQERVSFGNTGGFLPRKHCMQRLFPGGVIAPLFAKPERRLLSDSDVKIYDISSKALGDVPAVHILSPGYLDCNEIPGTEILATYRAPFEGLKFQESDAVIDPARITESLFYQEGSRTSKVLLTGSHPEISSTNVLSPLFKGIFRATNDRQQEIAGRLAESDAIRTRLLKSNFEKLGISCIPD